MLCSTGCSLTGVAGFSCAWTHASGKSGGAFPFEKKQPVKTPKGSGTVVKVEGRTAIVELDSAPIGETVAFDIADIEPLDTPF